MNNQGGDSVKELNISVAGAAGQGLQTVGMILAKVFVRGGCEVFAYQDNESRIRGGHNFFQLRVSHTPVRAASSPLHMLIALDRESINRHGADVAEEGLILIDPEVTPSPDEDARIVGLPLKKMAVEAGGEILTNSVAVGAALAFLGWEADPLESFLREHYSSKPAMADKNIQAARAGYDAARPLSSSYRGPVIGPREARPKMLVTGHEAVGLGALAAGCRFMSAYPMSPATAIMMFLAGKADEFGLVVEQAEDELAAANMAIGASWAGVRSLTATSGGGFSLMVEAFGLAAITETPLVVVEAQRPGPATGLPTRTAQGDLLFVLHAGQDEFPRLILAPGTAGEAFYATIKAFDLAEKYQIPAVILTDHDFANAYFTEERFDLSGIEIERHLIGAKEAASISEYKRYLLTESGISPRAVPGAFPFEVAADSHEHDEYGHITENAKKRTDQMEKRFRKLTGLTREISGPTLLGDPGADLALVGWGSSYGAMADAIDILAREGMAVKGIHLCDIWPFPGEQLSRALEGVSDWIVVESNYTGQLARLIQMELLQKPLTVIRKYTGRPFLPAEIAAAFRREVSNR